MGTDREDTADRATSGDGAPPEERTPPGGGTSGDRTPHKNETRQGDAARLDRALAVLAAPEKYEPGSEAHLQAANDVARLVTEHREAVAQRVDVLVEAFERTLDDERARPTPADTAEPSQQRVAGSRESLVEALNALAGDERARAVLVPTVQRWLADGNETLLRAGLVVGWALLDEGVSPAVHAAFAKALQPVFDREHEGYERVHGSVSQNPIQVIVPSESLPVQIPVSPEDVSDSELVTELWRFMRHLSAAAADALRTCDDAAVEHALACQDHFHGGTSAVLMNATTVLEAVEERDLHDCAPLTIANLAATVLVAYDDPSTEPYVSYDEPGALGTALAALEGVDRRSTDPIIPPFERIASVAEEHPDLMSEHAETLVALRSATARQEHVEELLDALATVAEADPASVAEHTFHIAAALDLDCDMRVAESVAAIFAEVASEYPGAVEPYVDDLVEAFDAMDDDPDIHDSITVGSFFLQSAIVMAHLAPAYPATVLEHERAVLEALRRANIDLLADEQIERLRQLLGAAVDDAIERDASPERLVDAIEDDTDTAADASVEECVATLSAALEAETDDAGGDSDAAADDGDLTPRRAMERLVELGGDRPRAVEPHLSTLQETVERFEDPELVVPALAVLSDLADANSRAFADRLEPVVEALVETDRTDVRINALLTLRNTADEAPEAVTPHLEHVSAVIEATDDENIAAPALEVLYNVSQECQAAVAPHLDPIVEWVTPNDDLTSLNARLTLYYVAREDPEAVGDHAGAVLDLIDETDPRETTGYAAETLRHVAYERPEVILSNFDRFASAMSAADDWRVVEEIVYAIHDATADTVDPALEYVDLLAETLADYLRAHEDRQRTDEAGDRSATGTADDESDIDWFVFSTLAVLNWVGTVDADLLEPHAPTIVDALEACTSARSARAACFSLLAVSEQDPEAVRPFLDSILEATIRFDDIDVIHAAIAIEDNLNEIDTDGVDDIPGFFSQNEDLYDTLDTIDESDATMAGALDMIRSMLTEYEIERLETMGVGFTWMLSGYVEVLEASPDVASRIAVREHAETLVWVARTADDSGVVEDAAEALYLLALHRPAAVATRADAVLDLLDGADPPHENEPVVLYLLAALSNVAREDTTAIADRTEVVAASVDPPSAVTDPILELGIDILSRVAWRPTALAPHVELLIEALSHTDDPDAVDDALRALLTVAGAEDEPAVRPHADEIGTAVGQLDDWTAPIRRLDTAQQKYPKLKLAVVEVLNAAVSERETVERDQAAPLRTALIRLADGIEPPMATARVGDLVARVGSTVPTVGLYENDDRDQKYERSGDDAGGGDSSEKTTR